MKYRYLTKYRFFYKNFRASKINIVIIHALVTDGVKFVSAIKKIKNMALIALIFDFESFNHFKQQVIPIITKPYMSTRYCQNMVYTTIFKICYCFFWNLRSISEEESPLQCSILLLKFLLNLT